MIGKLKKEFKRFFDVRMEFVLKKQQLTFDYMQISKLFKEEHFIPLSKWSLSPSVILHVLNDIFINKRENIIEFGSGASTIYIAKLIHTYNLKTNFFSVESDEEWINNIREQLDFLGLKQYVNLIHAPIKPIEPNLAFSEQKTWYDTSALSNSLKTISNFDLLIIDGPVGVSDAFTRYTAVPFLVEKLADDFRIFLDDTNRKHEKKIVETWKETLKCEPVYHDRYVTFSKSEKFDVKPMQLFGN